MKSSFDPRRFIVAPAAEYAVRLARQWEEVQAAQALRYEVFNLELNEGLEESCATGRDEDSFDAECDHLIVEHGPSGQVAGTYRLQTGMNAAAGLGYYSAQEFEFAVFEPLREEILELGRACVRREHRNLKVLGLLWQGIAKYARIRNSRYLIGCSSITSQDPAVGASAYADLCRRHLADPRFRTWPRPGFESPHDQLSAETPEIPKLLRAYLTIGAKICGPPALDQQFKTIDFLTLMDLQSLPSATRKHFLG